MVKGKANRISLGSGINIAKQPVQPADYFQTAQNSAKNPKGIITKLVKALTPKDALEKGSLCWPLD